MSLWWWLLWTQPAVPTRPPATVVTKIRILSCVPGFYCREELRDGGYGPREPWLPDGTYPADARGSHER